MGEEGGEADAVVGEVGLFAEDEDGVGEAGGEGAEEVFEEFFAGWGRGLASRVFGSLVVVGGLLGMVRDGGEEGMTYMKLMPTMPRPTTTIFFGSTPAMSAVFSALGIVMKWEKMD